MSITELEIFWGPLKDTPQEPFFDDDTPDSAILFCVGWGSGKTLTLWGKVLKLSAINYPLPGIWVVQQYDHIHHTLFPKLEELDPATGRPWFMTSVD